MPVMKALCTLLIHHLKTQPSSEEPAPSAHADNMGNAHLVQGGQCSSSTAPVLSSPTSGDMNLPDVRDKIGAVRRDLYMVRNNLFGDTFLPVQLCDSTHFGCS